MGSPCCIGWGLLVGGEPTLNPRRVEIGHATRFADLVPVGSATSALCLRRLPDADDAKGGSRVLRRSELHAEAIPRGLVLACESCNAAKAQMHPRMAEFWFHWGVPKCAARAMFEWEQGVDESEDWPWMVGGKSVSHPDGRREITKPPMGIGQCRDARCPDCA